MAAIHRNFNGLFRVNGGNSNKIDGVDELFDKNQIEKNNANIFSLVNDHFSK